MSYLSKEEIIKLDKYFRAVNYLSVGQLYLLDNPLLKRPLKLSDVKPNVVGHWGTAPGQNFIYLHLNRIIKNNNLNMIFISGPGHGGQAIVSNVYLEGSYTEIYPDITEDTEGLKKLFKQFSFPGGISSHVAPETPGSINEGGELGYSLSHAFGAVLDNPDLIAACVIGDGEAETGPLATSWQLNKIINKKNDGIVLPILHLNEYKIANPTIMGRMTDEQLESYFSGMEWEPYFVEGNDPIKMHDQMAKVLDQIVRDLKDIKDGKKINYPMIVLRTPKGWTGPKEVEDSFKAHQVPILVNEEHQENLVKLESWLKSYEPDELFNDNGSLKSELKDLTPKGKYRMGMNPNTNGGLLMKPINVPSFINYCIEVPAPGVVTAQDMMELGKYIKDIIKENGNNKNFRIFGPDEALSNRLNFAFEETNRQWNSKIKDTDELLNPTGRIIDSFLSEHACQGMLEGYLLTGRYGFFHTYEAFVRIVDSMASQHAKWLKVTKELSWRKEIASLNYILSSHIWQQDHNGYTHQDPGFLNHLVTKKADIVRIYLPPDTNTLLSCFEHCIKSKGYINAIVASKHPRPQWLNKKQALEHCKKGLGVWKFASNNNGEEPDLVLACCGDTPTMEILAATKILNEYLPELKIRVVNVVDLMKLQSNLTHPHGLTDREYDELFTIDKPIIFAFHGYPNLIHQLTYNRHNQNLHVHGYNEEGTITTPFDMRVQNKMDRYSLVQAAISRLNNLGVRGFKLNEYCKDMLIKHNSYIKEFGEDIPEVKNWKW